MLSEKPESHRFGNILTTIYTDGACFPNPGRGGWSFVAYEDGKEIYSDCGGEENTTNNRMEFMGILSALKWVADEPATIYTDSQYCLNSLTVWWRKWEKKGWVKGKGKKSGPVKNLELIRACLAAFKPIHQLVWCRGHVGIEGNERADELATIGQQLYLDDGEALKQIRAHC